MSEGNNPFELEPEEPRKDPAPAPPSGNGRPSPAPKPPPPPIYVPPERPEDKEVDTRTVAERAGEAPPRSTEGVGNPPDWPQEALRFPLAQHGPKFMAFVIVPLFVLDLLGPLPAGRFIGWTAKLVFFVYMLRAQLFVIGSSAGGYDAPRDWNKALQFDKDDLWSYFRTLGMFGFLLAPGIVLWAFEKIAPGMLLILLGSMYAAVVAMGAALGDSSIKYPWNAVRWISTRPLHCLAGSAAWWALMATELALHGLRDQGLSLVAFVALALRVVCAYLLLVSARALGVMGRAWNPA